MSPRTRVSHSLGIGRIASPAFDMFVVLVFSLVISACGRFYLYPGVEQEQQAGGAAAGASGPGAGQPGPVGPGGSNAGGSQAGGQGGGGTCGTDFDCNDDEFCTTDRCVQGSCENKPRDEDGDGFVDELCGGDDCNDLNPNANPSLGEQCSDAADNDCNGVADCFDPVCSNDPNCGCVPDPGGEICDNGQDDDCDTTVDCNDADCSNTPICGCLPNETGLCADGLDQDCDGLFDCDDPDCANDQVCDCQASTELCGNNSDEDCDDLVDCADPDCAGSPNCNCIPPGTPEVCTDAQDNDCDGQVDCADPDCANSPACKQCTVEVCDDGIDNDCDNLIDCADDACAFAPNCAPTQELCNNSKDDDNDTLIDCADPDCANNPLCLLKQENCLSPKLINASGAFTGDTTGNVGNHQGQCGGGAGEAIFFFTLSQPSFVRLDSIGTSFDSVIYVRKGSCEVGPEIACDDDSGGSQWAAAVEFDILYPGTYYVFVDGFTIDPVQGANEGPFVLNVQIEPNPKEDTVQRCSDGKDNDGDVYVDCADPDCQNVGACLNCNAGAPPSAEFGVGKCTDGQDNDCDGFSDANDSDCDASPYASSLEDCTGTDQNDNGIADDFSCRCANDNECGMGQICYTRTVQACGIPCFQFFGNVCPSIATGSSCNTTTGQCEF